MEVKCPDCGYSVVAYSRVRMKHYAVHCECSMDIEPVAQLLVKEIERLQTMARLLSGTVSTMFQWEDKHPQDVYAHYYQQATESEGE